MLVLRLSVSEMSFQHHSCVADYGPEIHVVTQGFYVPPLKIKLLLYSLRYEWLTANIIDQPIIL